jgi:hypothetical protein
MSLAARQLIGGSAGQGARNACVLLMGYRGPYVPRRPVLAHPPEGTTILLRPRSPENAAFFRWERCAFCREEFRLAYPAEWIGPDVLVLTCSRLCARKAVRKESAPHEARSRRRPVDVVHRATSAWREWREAYR